MTEVLIILACLVITLLPPGWDPAIRLKEWVLSQREEKDEDDI